MTNNTNNTTTATATRTTNNAVVKVLHSNYLDGNTKKAEYIKKTLAEREEKQGFKFSETLKKLETEALENITPSKQKATSNKQFSDFKKPDIAIFENYYNAVEKLRFAVSSIVAECYNGSFTQTVSIPKAKYNKFFEAYKDILRICELSELVKPDCNDFFIIVSIAQKNNCFTTKSKTAFKRSFEIFICEKMYNKDGTYKTADEINANLIARRQAKKEAEAKAKSKK